MTKQLAIITLVVFALSNCHQTVSQCTDLWQQCSVFGDPCCEGTCRSLSTAGDHHYYCVCYDDSVSAWCTSDAQCCAGYCNSMGYCGCIPSGFFCNEGFDDECCGNNGVKTCTSAFPIHYQCY